jgi:outer membrane receptor protein involved in Fe transport
LTAPTNLGTGKIKGFEIELQASPTAQLMLNAQAGYARFTSSDAAYLGERQLATPDWTASAGAQYEIGLADSGTLNLRLDWYFQSRVDYALDSDPLVSTAARGLWNGMIAWDPNAKWTLSLHGFNLADKQYYVNKFTLIPFGLATLEGQPGTPREWRISARYRF